MRKKETYRIHSQIALPFRESDITDLRKIFWILQKRFKLIRGSTQKLIDLGSGNGQVIIFSSLFYNIKSIGIEINPTLIKESRQRIQELKKKNPSFQSNLDKAEIRNKDLFEENLIDFDFIYIFSYPKMQRFLKHVFKTAKEGAIVISYYYPFKGFEMRFHEEYQLRLKHDNIKTKVYFYRIKN